MPTSCERALVLGAQCGGEAEKDRLVSRYLPLIRSIARGYRSGTVERGELLQEGVVGLLRALERYDSRRPTPFWAYASWYVREAMQSLIAELSGPVVLSDRAHRQLARIKDAQDEHVRRGDADPATCELASDTGLPVERIARLLAAKRKSRPLDQPLAGHDEGTPADYTEILVDPRAEDDYDQMLRRVDAERLPGMLRRLNERERAIVRARFGLGEPARTLEELSGLLGVTAERVRQVEQHALDKLRDVAL